MQYLFALTLLLAPTYAIRFSLFGLPANLLLVWIFVLWTIFAAWLIYSRRINSFKVWLLSELSTKYLVLSTVFLIAGISSLFVGGISQEKLGQFIVLFLQPIGTFIILRYLHTIGNWKLPVRHSFSNGGEIGNLLIQTALLFVSVAGIYAIIQYFTLIGVPQAWWGNSEEPKRAVSFFLHPNFYALFVTPLLAFLIPVVSGQWSVARKGLKLELLTTFAWLVGVVGLFLSLSRGGWLGLLFATIAYLILAGNRKLVRLALVAGAVAVLVIIAVPNFRYRLLLPFRGEKSSVARFSLWQTGWKMVEDAPLMGKGLLGFSNNWYRYNTDQQLEHYPAPHNIALNFWADTGLLGLLSFFGLLFLAIWRGIKNRTNIYQLGLALACIALITHGLIDIPYFKGDLALVFWMLYAFL